MAEYSLSHLQELESLEEICQSMNLTTERVKQIRERAIKRLVENGKR